MIEIEEPPGLIPVFLSFSVMPRFLRGAAFPEENSMKRWTVALFLVLTGMGFGGLMTRSYLQGQVQPPPVMPKELTSYRDIVKRVLPAVVSIEPRARAARLGFGSGVLVDPSGVVLTNHHVVDGASEVTVQLSDGRKFVSKDIKSDAKTDLAIVRIKPEGKLPFMEMGDSDAMEIGDRVLAVGSPFGLTGSVTHGIISGKGRSLQMNLYEDFLQTDAAINPGNSGGPLISLEGKLIGINTAIKSRSGGFQGVGLAISSNLARNVMKKLETEGVVHRGYLGVQVRDLNDPALVERLGLAKGTRGVIVTRTFEDTPATKGGIQEGDVVTAINGQPIDDGRELQRVVANLPLNKAAKMSVVRKGEMKTVAVVIEEQPSDLGSLTVPDPTRPTP
jgi:serine protease Do